MPTFLVCSAKVYTKYFQDDSLPSVYVQGQTYLYVHTTMVYLQYF